MVPSGPLRVDLLVLQTADETTSQAIDLGGRANAVFYLIGDGGTINAGSVTYEESTPVPGAGGSAYSGDWSIIGSAVTASDVSAGKQKATHLSIGAYSQVRARIDTAVEGGGAISVVLIAY